MATVSGSPAVVSQTGRAPRRVFLLSPANCGGTRGGLICAPAAMFPLARQLRTPAGAPLGEVFSFVSGLYFRGKLAYARRFARPPGPGIPVVADGALVITPNAGLCDAGAAVTEASFRAFAGTPVDSSNPAYREPLEQSARMLAEAVDSSCEIVLLGSIASGKYVDVLQPVFGDRLLFPADFVGRGDMSRGGLLCRCAAAGVELAYVTIAGAVRHGRRPPRLAPVVPLSAPRRAPARKDRTDA